MTCRHCGVGKRCRPKGLCWPCSMDPAVRALYPSACNHGAEPTAEELDRLVAEGMADLPAWWHQDCRGEWEQQDVPKRVVRVWRRENGRWRG